MTSKTNGKNHKNQTGQLTKVFKLIILHFETFIHAINTMTSINYFNNLFTSGQTFQMQESCAKCTNKILNLK